MNLNHPTLPAAIGAALAGGFFAGIIRINGEEHALVVAPKDIGEKKGIWNGSDKPVPGATSYFDGLENTVAMAEAGSELAQWARTINHEGFDDWYIPSRDELEIVYRNLKPTTETNATYRSGDNPSSSPVGYPYTRDLPAQTAASAFQEGGAEALADDWYCSSTQRASNTAYAWGQDFDFGYQDDFHKSYAGRARAVRRFKL